MGRRAVRVATIIGGCLLSQWPATHAQVISFGTRTVRMQTTAAWDGADAVAVASGSVQEGTPSDLVQLTDGTGRFLVSTLGGTIHVLNRAGQLLTSPGAPLLNPSQTGNTIEFNLRYGLNSLALHPDFANPSTYGFGKAYGIATQPFGAGTADFTPTGIEPDGNGGFRPVVATAQQDVLFEYDLRDLVGTQPASLPNFSRREIVRFQQAGGSHNTVDISFRNNGELYLAVGDSTASSLQETSFRLQAAQDLDQAFGKVLRFSPDPNAFTPGGGSVGVGAVSANGNYSISANNPYFNTPGALQEVYANGLRSPYRLNIDPQDENVVWLGDVGESSREEVNRIVAGGNYGWGLVEGSIDAPGPFNHPPLIVQGNPQLTGPEFEYSHSNLPDVEGGVGGGLAVIGGFIYRGTELGTDVQGHYIGGEIGNFFGRANVPRIFFGDPGPPDDNPRNAKQFLLDPAGTRYESPTLGSLGLPALITSIGEGNDGELWVLGIDRTTAPGIDEGDGMPGRLLVARVLADGSITGDFTGAGAAADGIWDCFDLDALSTAIAQGTGDLAFDMNGDGILSVADITDPVDGWLAVGGLNNPLITGGNPFLVGDADLDGLVDGRDFLTWNAHKFTSNSDWCRGDFNADGLIDGRDFMTWNSNKFSSSKPLVVPEPATVVPLSFILLSFGCALRHVWRSV